MDRTEYLLTQAASEACEVAHRVTKALHFGLKEIQPGHGLTNAERIVEEYIQLKGVMQMLEDERIIQFPLPRDEDRMVAAKIARVEDYMEYARKVGSLK